MSTVRLLAFTDTGLVRDHNEDALLVGSWLCQSAAGSVAIMEFDDAGPLVCAVADGMGGHAAGDLASRIALGVIGDAAPRWREPADVKATLLETNDRVHAVGRGNPDLRGMGTTVAGILVLEHTVVVFNVGDSRVYGLDGGFLTQISVDDAVLDDHGRPTSTITQSLGQHQPITPHLTVVPRDGSTYLICSDGVSGGMSASALRAAALKSTLRDCVSSIVDETRANGAGDNFSVILVDVPPGTGPAMTGTEPAAAIASATPMTMQSREGIQ